MLIYEYERLIKNACFKPVLTVNKMK